MAKKKVAKVPLWQALVDRSFLKTARRQRAGFCPERVLVNGQRGNTAGELIREDAEIYVKGIDLKYVGKGGLKLEGALADFKMSGGRESLFGRGCVDGWFYRLPAATRCVESVRD